MNSMDFLRGLLENWRQGRDDRIKLQHAYIGIALISIVVSGLVSLLNVDIGRKLAFVAVAAIAVFLVNGLVWSVLNSTLLQRAYQPPVVPAPQPTRKSNGNKK